MNQDLATKIKDIFLPWRGQSNTDYKAQREAELAAHAFRYKGKEVKIRGYRDDSDGLKVMLCERDSSRIVEYVPIRVDDPALTSDADLLHETWGYILGTRKVDAFDREAHRRNCKVAGDDVVPDLERAALVHSLMRQVADLAHDGEGYSSRVKLPPKITMVDRKGEKVRILGAVTQLLGEPFFMLGLAEKNYPHGELRVLQEGKDIDADVPQLEALKLQLTSVKLTRQVEKIRTAAEEHESNKPSDYHCKPGDLIYCTAGHSRNGFLQGSLVGIVEKYDQPLFIQNESMGFSRARDYWVSGVVAVNGHTFPEDLSAIRGVLVGEDFALYDNHAELIARAVATTAQSEEDSFHDNREPF